MLNWKPEYIALLSRYYRENVLRVATEAGYLEANAEIGRAAHVRGSTVERWITGERFPDPTQAERLLRWAGREGWWTIRGEGRAWVTIADKLHEVIKDSKRK